MDAEIKEDKIREFVEQIARMQTEEETLNGFTWEDNAASMNSLIQSAREVSGIDPQHPKVFCLECQSPADECDCNETEEDDDDEEEETPEVVEEEKPVTRCASCKRKFDFHETMYGDGTGKSYRCRDCVAIENMGAK